MRRLTLCLFLVAAGMVAAQPSDEAVKKELKRFQGKWQAVSAQAFDGKAQTDAELQFTMLEVTGDKFVLKTGSLTVNGTFKIDPTKKIKTIDVYLGDAADKPSLKGVYEIKDGIRISCFAEPNKERPDRIRKEKGFMILEWRGDK